MTHPQWCPTHGHDQDPADAWDCPDDCPHFIAEIERVVEDIRVNGNYVRSWSKDGIVFRQRMVNHQPVGEAVAVRLPHKEEQ